MLPDQYKFMPNPFFHFKQFSVWQDRCAMKVTTDGCCFGAWVAAVLRDTGMRDAGQQRILDIGTGTGLLALMVAQQNSSVIDAVEIDAGAAAQAGSNAAASPWPDRVNVINTDIRQYHPDHPYAVIMSNPPFYENDLRGPDAVRNMAHHDTGLSIQDLLHFTRQYLQRGGQFFLLLPYKRMEEAKRLFAHFGFRDYHILKIRQSPAHDFFRVVFYVPGQAIVTGLPTELVIADAPGVYSAAFAGLLAPYYQQL